MTEFLMTELSLQEPGLHGGGDVDREAPLG